MAKRSRIHGERPIERSMAALRVRVLTDPAELAAIAGPWDALVRNAALPCPFALQPWLDERMRRLAGRVSPAILVAERGGEVVGGLPLGVERRVGVRVAGLLPGDTVSHVDILAADEEAGEAIVAALATVPADLIVATGIVPASRLAQAPGFRLVERERSPFLLMPDGWDAAYTGLVSSRRRREHARCARRLAAVGEVTFSDHRTPEAVVAGLEEAFALHDGRFAAAVDRSDFRSPVDRATHLSKARRLAEAGHVRLALLRVEGELAAFGYSLVVGDVGWLFRSAIAERFVIGQPGIQLLHHALREMAAEGVTRVEFLGGAYPYKLAHATGEVPLLQATGYAAGAPARVVLAAQRAAVGARVTLKRSETLRRAYVSSRRLLGRRAA